jgi:hypothetical protein
VHPDIDLAGSTSEEVDRSFRRVYELLQRALPDLPQLLLRQRYLSLVSFVMFSLADYERLGARRSRNSRPFDLQRAIENLIDMVTGALAAPVSAQVRQRLSAQDADMTEALPMPKTRPAAPRR